ncbi:MAG TPA: hypothetical protein VFO35_14500, partial [Steroidobacteraceae bacterium]|nr:hypothetical protein [Steroidobacteraceae bacterium]
MEERDDTIEPEAFAFIELDHAEIARSLRDVPGGARNVQSIYPLSPLQEGMLFHHLLDQNSDTYVLSTL